MKKMLSQKQIKHFKALAHHLNPIILIGDKGLTDAVVQETELSLFAHELIKVKINNADRLERNQIADQLAKYCNAEIIQTIGRMVVLYKKKLT